jgi:GTP-binding protein
VFVTATTGRNVYPLINLAQHLFKQTSARVSTSEINRVLQHALAQQAPPLRQNRRPKIYYGTQVAAQPPTIVLFTNGPELFSNTYQRYLLKAFRDHLPFHDVPIKLYLRSRGGTADGEEPADEATAARERKRPGRGKKRRGRKSELWEDV